MATASSDNKASEYVFRVSGQLISTPGGQRVEISAQRASGAPQVLRAVAGRDVVALSIAGGPTLRLHPAHAELLLRSQQGGSDRSGGGVVEGVTLEVPGQLAFAEPSTEGATGTSRGVVGRLVLKAIEVITGKNVTQASALTAAAALEGKTGPGLHALPRQAVDGLPSFAGQAPVPIAPSPGRPVLVFVHGTFSNTTGSFSHLWRKHPQLVDRLFGVYGGVYGLDHHSVTDNPFANALLIAKSLPVGARVHVVTHSRGGLVAEALVRAMRNDGQDPYDAVDRKLLAGADYAAHRNAMEGLNAEFKRAQPRIERIVRVAGPARGTLLASGRLDAYLSVFEWGLSVAQVPVLPELVDFIGEVARERTDPMSLPGVEAMIPGRPVMQVLTRPDLRLASDLRIVAGDIQGDSVLSWLKVLLTDAFYLTEHDLVVNTNSMYGGTPRLEAPTFVFERGRQVTHFNYFANESSALAIVDGLTLASPAQFRQVGPLSWDGKSSDGVRAVRKAVANTGQRPAVFVLPGIMGSHLKVDGRRVWAAPGALFFGGLKKLKYPGAKVEPEEPMDRYFGDLMEDLSDRYDVIPFAYDWRLPIEESARILAAQIDKELHVRAGRKLPVRILAHSMGGMVTRAVELEAPDIWNRFVSQEGARVVLVGTPNRGAYAPMLALSAMHPLVNGVEAIDTCTSWKELKAILGDFPGLLQLQWLDTQFDLTRRSTWEELAAHHRDTPLPPDLWHEGGASGKRRWGIPSQDALDKLRELRDRLDARVGDYRRLGDKLVLVAGSAPETIAGIRKGRFGIEFMVTEAGDGTVPWESLRLPGVEIWRADPEHGDLLKFRSVFGAYRELLETGSTTALPKLGAAARGAPVEVVAADRAALRPWVPLRAPYAPTPGEIEAAALGAAGFQRPAALPAAAATALPLDVQIVHGNLKYVAEPLLVGHYRSALLTGTEKVLDRWLDGTLQKAVNLGAYAEAVGEQRIFVNRRGPRMQLSGQGLPKPCAVVVAGLGEEDELSVAALRKIVAQSAIAWVQHCVHNRPVVPSTLELAAVLVGSGGIRIDVAESALAIVQGVIEANRRLFDESLPTIALLMLVEIYGDRASIAHSAIHRAQTQLSEVRLAPRVITGQGGRRRPVERGYRGTDQDRVHVRSDGAGGENLDFEMHSGRARGEKRAQSTQRLLVDRLLADAAREPNYNPVLAHALFSMLIPLEMRPLLGSARSLQWSLDERAARIPWEMLNDRPRGPGTARNNAERPLALRVSMVRELRLENFRPRPVDNRQELNVLVIGEPKSDPTRYSPLPGARREAEAVVELLRGQDPVVLDCTPLMQPTAVEVVQHLHDKPWRIIHIAGHGDYAGNYGGVVLDHGAFLGAKEIAGLATVPELVFVNCCHIGAIDGASATIGQRRLLDDAPTFAAGIALELIKIGVRCVVAAGWAVDDTGALHFARAFYRELLGGRNFADSVRMARDAAAAANAGGTTWAAYQCYGDPGWTLRGLAVDTVQPITATEALPLTPTRQDLSAALTEIEVDAQDATDDPDIRMRRAARLAALEQREARSWPDDGAVAEQFANAWAAVGDLGKAEQWYVMATEAGDGRASMRATEQLINVRVRRASLRDDVRTIRAALVQLDELIGKRPSAERWSLRGSACKRLATVTLRRARGPGRYSARVIAEARRHLVDAADAYRRGSELATSLGQRTNFYATMQWACTLLLERLLTRAPLRDALFDRVMAEARVAIAEADRQAPDFWSAIAPAEWQLYDSLASETLDQTYRDIGAEFDRVHERDAGPRNWSSVSDSLEIVALTMWAQTARKSHAEALHGLGKLVRGWCAAA